MRVFEKITKSVMSFLGYDILLKKKRSNSFPASAFEAQREILQRQGKNNVCIFDIGANEGNVAALYSTLLPTAEIYCFEPFPDSISILKEKCSDKSGVHIIEKAVADKVGTAQFYVNESAATNSLLPRPTEERRYYPKTAGFKESIEVEITTIDNFVKEHKLANVDVLKFDIQGGELNALHGAKELLASGKVSVIYTEILFVHLYKENPLFFEIWNFLSQYGYSLLDIYHLNRAKNGQLKYGDALFVHESVRSKVFDEYPEEP